jgi:HEAT repeats/PBS lyase HEAT-like repeat
MSRSWLLTALLASHLCGAQVTGTFSLEKSTFAPGEPVFLSFTLHNEGKEREEIVTADPYSFCSGYQLHITREGAPAQACLRLVGGGSCLSGAIPLEPGASHTERILLNYQDDSRSGSGAHVSAPGDYMIDASRDIAFAPPGPRSRLFTAADHSRTHQTLHVRVDDSLELSPTVYAPYVQQLQSPDIQVHREAARVLATLAPPELESLLLTFPTSKDDTLRQFAPLALANLSTKASLSSLAQMLLHTEPGTYEYMTAAQKLAKTHDPSWFPLLLEVTDQHGDMYLPYAAESGGDAALPTLLARLRTTNPSNRNNVIRALGQTGSRAAVPILIQLLESHGNPTEENGRNNAITANVALQQLTHLYAEQGPDGSLIPTWHNRWQQWWLTSGSSATIYKPTDCVADTKLP